MRAVQLPGREGRLREPALRSVPNVVEAVGPALLPFLDKPFAFFGHSMGTLLAFEVARWLRRTGNVAPIHLFVSGRSAPHTRHDQQRLYILDDANFVREIVDRYNGIPQVVLQDTELLHLFLPTMRADMEVVETYTYTEEPPLSCPITAFAGTQDRLVGLAGLETWRAQTHQAFATRMFPGDHFYLQQERAALIAAIARSLVSHSWEALSIG